MAANFSTFTYTSLPARIVFGAGKAATVAQELENLSLQKALILSTPEQRGMAEQVAQQLPGRCVGIFDQATMHTPTDITERALSVYHQHGADAVVAVGGGSTVGLAKAIAYRTPTTQVVLPTTYAGSEVTPILGQTENNHKTTVRHPRILPQVVIYDPELSQHLPVEMSIMSGLNAMAHAVEALYAQDRNPVSSLMAVQGIEALYKALPVLREQPDHLEARSQALMGAWLCGTVLGTVGMSLHHKLCHTLGGRFNTPHAPTHAVLLPHSISYNAQAAAAELAPLQAFFGEDIALGMYEFAAALGAPLALKDFGLQEADLDEAALLATQTPYWNPRALDKASLRSMLGRAWEGSAPKSTL